MRLTQMTTEGRQWPGKGRTQQIEAAPHIDAPVRAGDVIAQRYRVENVIGVGGMGIVVAAVHIDLHQRVAIKLVLPSAMNDVVLRERFVREARAAAQLRSEHVAKVLDVGTLPSGVPYMVMDLLEGCDLGALVARGGPLPADAAASYVAQACEAVAEAHARGIVHRDIKPQNLFLTTSVGGAPLVKVLDFGVSKITIGGENLTKSTTVMGSPLYMSPEQMRSAREVDARSDVWSLGVVLYELLTGHVPFDCASIPALCLKVASDAPTPIARVRSDVPDALAAIVMRCLEKNPRDRFQSAADLASALGPFAPPRIAAPRAAPVQSVAPVSITQEIQPAPRARRAKTSTLAVIVAAFFAFGAIAGAAIKRAPEAPQRANASMAVVIVAACSFQLANDVRPTDPPIAQPAPSTAPELASALPKPAPSPKPIATISPPKPTSADDDEIPSMR